MIKLLIPLICITIILSTLIAIISAIIGDYFGLIVNILITTINLIYLSIYKYHKQTNKQTIKPHGINKQNIIQYFLKPFIKPLITRKYQMTGSEALKLMLENKICTYGKYNYRIKNNQFQIESSKTSGNLAT